MSLLPVVLNTENKKILIIGGGNIATEKTKKVLNFTKNITIISPEISNELKNIVERENLKYIKRTYKEGDLNKFDIVINCVDDLNFQKYVYEKAKKEKILCNSVDCIEYSDFIFPSVVKKGDFILSISTSGNSPALAKYLRIFFENFIPDEIEKFLEDMNKLRKQLPKGKERQDLFKKKAKEFIKNHLGKSYI
jgi:precorrin-2 dehydrogenase/sirohydrochlorin ferrochelatase